MYSLLGADAIHDETNGWFYVHAPGIDEPVLAVRRNPVDTTELARLDIVSTGAGQVLAIGDSAGGLNSAYAYAVPGSNGGPWGSGLAARAQTFNPLRWATVLSTDTIASFRTRQYDPATGSWLQEDHLGLAGGTNLYEYNRNDPNSFRDPFGLVDDCCLLNSVANAAAGFGDMLTLGLTQKVRRAIGADDVVNKSSGAYIAGGAAALVVVPEEGGAEAVAAEGRIAGAVSTAESAVGDVTVEVGSRAEAEAAGERFVGEGARDMGSQRPGGPVRGRVSADATRIYRYPTMKATGQNAGREAANLVRKVNGEELGNTHLIFPGGP